MKVLVAGSIPPPPGGRQDSLLAEVLGRRAAGDEVEVISLDHLAAAHRYFSGPGLAAVAELAIRVRPADAVIVQLEPGLPVRHSAGRAERTFVLMTLARVLSTKSDVTIRIEDRDDLPGGHGGRAGVELWRSATRIEVGSADLAAELACVLGDRADRISVVELATAGGQVAPAIGAETWGEGVEATAERVMTVVRQRAAAQRQDLGLRGRLPIPGGGMGIRVPQWSWLPVAGAGVPDLGPSRVAVPALRSGQSGAGQSGAGRRRRSPRSSVAVVGRRFLAAADSRPATKPVASLVRLAAVEARSRLR